MGQRLCNEGEGIDEVACRIVKTSKVLGNLQDYIFTYIKWNVYKALFYRNLNDIGS